MSLPYVSTDLHTSQERQHRTQIANALNECIKVRPPNDVTEAEVAAGVTPANYAYPPGDVRRYGANIDGLVVSTSSLQKAIDAEGQSANGAQGGGVKVPSGTILLDASVNLDSRVTVCGNNKRGTIFKADASFSQTQMFTVLNGTSSMFDNRLENCTINCNDISGLSGVISDAWQEGGGIRDVLIQKFTDYGILFQNGYGGAAVCSVKDSEIFGSTSGASAGIRANSTLSAVGGFLLRVENTTISGGGPLNTTLPFGIQVEGASLCAINAHFEYCQSGIYLDGPGHHVIIGCSGASGGSLVDNLVEIASTFTGTLVMIGCLRNGATNFLKDNRSGGFGTITATDYPLFTINSLALPPVAAIGANWSGGLFDGTAGSPTLTAGFNVTSITKNGTGDYTITETRGRTGINTSAPWASTNSANASTRCDLAGASTYRIRHYVGGVLADANEIKFGNVRLA